MYEVTNATNRLGLYPSVPGLSLLYSSAKAKEDENGRNGKMLKKRGCRLQLDYTTKLTLLVGPRSAAISPHEMSLPRASRVKVYNTSAGRVSVDMSVVGRSSS